jgi:integrase
VRLTEEQESRVLEAANCHLRAVTTAILETACRPGEILALQWKDVSLERRGLILTAEKTKTRSERLVPISRRLHAVLEMRQTGAVGKRLPPEAYVFGNDVGERVKSVRTAWENARVKAGLGDVHLADIRHEAASRFDEAGVPVNFVSKILGHTNLTTTSRYLNIHRRGLHLAMEKFEESRRLASLLQTESTDTADGPATDNTPPVQKPLVS